MLNVGLEGSDEKLWLTRVERALIQCLFITQEQLLTMQRLSGTFTLTYQMWLSLHLASMTFQLTLDPLGIIVRLKVSISKTRDMNTDRYYHFATTWWNGGKYSEFFSVITQQTLRTVLLSNGTKCLLISSMYNISSAQYTVIDRELGCKI